MKATHKLALCLTLVAFAASASAATLYLTETDDDGTVYIIDTESGFFSTVDVSPQENPGAIAITGSRIVMSNYDDDGIWEYNLALEHTGNSWPGSGTWSQMLDGTTDGVNNYSVSWSSNGVIECDLNFENCVLLFDPGFGVIGITYDPTDDSLWLVNDDDISIENYTKGGVFVDSFDADFGDRNCCLAYDPADDTLWMSTNGGSTMYNFSKSGNLLDSVTIQGLVADNTWGAEISGLAFPGLVGDAPIPAMSGWSLTLMALMLGLVGLFVGRRMF